MSKRKTIEFSDLGLSTEDMELLVAGARVIFPETDPQEDETLSLTGEQKTGP